MITHELRSWSVGDQREALATSTHDAPVLAVPAGCRRPGEIIWAQARAQGLINDLHAKRVGDEHIRRWWRAWTRTPVETVQLFVSTSARPEVLLQYVATLADWNVNVHLWFPEEVPNAMHVALEELSSTSQERSLPVRSRVDLAAGVLGVDLPLLAPPLMLQHLNDAGHEYLASTLLGVAGDTGERLEADASAAAFLDQLLGTCRQARSEHELEIVLHGLAIGAWSAGLPIGLEPRTVARLAGPALMALSPGGPGDRAGRWLDAVRGAALVLSLSRLEPAAVCSTTLDEAAALSTELHGMAAAALRVAVAARHDDGARPDEPLLVDPTRGAAVTTDTVARWLRLGQRDQVLPLLHGPTSKALRPPEKALRQIGVSWRN